LRAARPTRGHTKRPQAQRERTRISAELAGLKGDERDAAGLKTRTEERPTQPNVVCGVAGLDVIFAAPKECQRDLGADRQGQSGADLCGPPVALAHVLGFVEQCVDRAIREIRPDPGPPGCIL